jgi:hypothetical protein
MLRRPLARGGDTTGFYTKPTVSYYIVCTPQKNVLAVPSGKAVGESEPFPTHSHLLSQGFGLVISIAIDCCPSQRAHAFCRQRLTPSGSHTSKKKGGVKSSLATLSVVLHYIPH